MVDFNASFGNQMPDPDSYEVKRCTCRDLNHQIQIGSRCAESPHSYRGRAESQYFNSNMERRRLYVFVP
jgi:hypothetical protein